MILGANYLALISVSLLAACGGPPANPLLSVPAEDPLLTQHPIETSDPTAQEPSSGSIFEALNDPDAAVRDLALEQLAQLETQASAITLQLLITDPDKNVREDAVDALAEVDTPLARELLLRATYDTHPAVREAAQDALSDL